MKKVPIIAAALLAAGLGQAHHDSDAQFDPAITVELSGVITGIRWVNPHAYVNLAVTGANDESVEWRCEMRAAAALKRSGWSQDMFRPGSIIRIEGVPARREENTCHVRSLSIDGGPLISRYEQLDEAEAEFDDTGRPAVLPNGQPNISGDWAAPQRLLEDGEQPRRSRAGFRSPRYAQTDTGKAAVEYFEVAMDNPRYNCEAVNVIADWVFGQHVNRIEQADDTITLTYGFMDIVRTIHLDLDEHPRDVAPSRSGHSVGRWEGDMLVVDTIGLTPGYLDGQSGIMHSDQLHIIERFTFDPANQSLVREYTVEDPLYLAAPFTDRDVVFLTATAFEPYNCEDLTRDYGLN